MTVYAYIRVSTDRQTVENQRFEISNYCNAHDIHIDKWIEDEGVSGAKDYSKRSLGRLISGCKSGDTIICSEISRLGRDLLMLFEILNKLIKKGVRLYTIKDNFSLEDNIQTKVLAFAFGIASEIERKLISQRTKESLARLKAEGVKLGIKPGSHIVRKTKLDGCDEDVLKLINQGYRMDEICKKLRVSRSTLYRFLDNSELFSKENKR